MGYQVNGIEVIQRPTDNQDYISLPAVAADTWEQDCPLYWLTGSDVVKAFKPADSTAGGALQGLLIGLAAAGKKAGDVQAVVMRKCQIIGTLVGSTWIGANHVVLYNATTLKFSFQEDAAYDAAYEPNLSLTGNFAVALSQTAENTDKIKFQIDGTAHFAALT
jgi:hypothetical protein